MRNTRKSNNVKLRRRNIVFYGHHKCGSRYFRNYILREIAAQINYEYIQYDISGEVFEYEALDALDLENIRYERLREGGIILGLTNASPQNCDRVFAMDPDHVGLHAIRDPRQMLVSAYANHLKGHPVKTPLFHWRKLETDRKMLQKLSVEEGLVYELDNITGEALDKQICPWKKRKNIIEFKLEKFDMHSEIIMKMLFRKLGIPSIHVKPDKDKHHSNKASRHWSEIFTDRVKTVFKARYGDLLIELGYARNNAW